MPKTIDDKDLEAIENVIAAHAKPISAKEIADELGVAIPLRTLQYRLRKLVDQNRVVREGGGKSAVYRIFGEADLASAELGERSEKSEELVVPISDAGKLVREYVNQPLGKRKPVGYDRGYLESYKPNHTAYLTESERRHLRKLGTSSSQSQPAGTYAMRIMNRLLIDLSWNSSRLEGNTYSLLDTKRLIQFGEEAEGKAAIEAQMIMNHKDAIEFLVESADEIGFNRYTLLNLHALLANNLLPDPHATGRLRHISVGIEKSVFHPLELPQVIEESFELMLQKATEISDPFEQAFFMMVQLPYLQPFDDVNKRVSRLAANIPLIRSNFTPLSFTDVPKRTYTEATLGIYELTCPDLLKDVFLWAYERSCQRYQAVKQSIGSPDPFRMKHRENFKLLVNKIITKRLGKKAAVAYIKRWTKTHIDEAEWPSFTEMLEDELIGLHEGNIARYRIRPSQFQKWQRTWQEE